jgi:hypothetical protein
VTLISKRPAQVESQDKQAIAALAALYAANGTGNRDASDVTLMIRPLP